MDFSQAMAALDEAEEKPKLTRRKKPTNGILPDEFCDDGVTKKLNRSKPYGVIYCAALDGEDVEMERSKFEQGGVVPIVRLLGAQPLLDSVADNGHQLVPFGFRFVAALSIQQRRRIHSRVGIAEVGFEPTRIGFDTVL